MKQMLILFTTITLMVSCEKKETCQAAFNERDNLLDEREHIIYTHANNHAGSNSHTSSNVHGTKYNSTEYNDIQLIESKITQQENILANHNNRCKFNYKYTETALD